MQKEIKKFCPFKKTVIRNPKKFPPSYSERFAECAAERCMAYKDGKCAFVEKGRKP